MKQPTKELAEMIAVEIDQKDTAAALKAVLLHTTSTSDHLPPLESVQMVVTDKAVTFTATNRFTVGRAHVERKDENSGEATFLLPAAAAKELARLAGALKYAPLALEIEETLLTVRNIDGTSVQFRAHDFQFPKIDVIFDAALAYATDTNVTLEPVIYTPHLLGLFSKAAGRHDKLTVWPAPDRKPRLVTVGDHFAGVIMPQRGEAKLSDWIAPAAAPTAETAAA